MLRRRSTTKYQIQPRLRRRGAGTGGVGPLTCSGGAGAGSWSEVVMRDGSSLILLSPFDVRCERLGQLGLGDDDHPLVRHLEAALPVVVQVVADGGVRRDLHVLVDNRPADAAVPADVHAVEQD